MISVDFSIAISLYLILVTGIVLIVWLLAKTRRHKELSLDPRFIWHCSVCTYTYINTKEEMISTCPRCGSYNKK